MTRQLVGGLLVALFATFCAAASPATRKAMPAPAERQLTDVRFDQIALGDVLDFYRDVSGANFVIRWEAMKNLGVNPAMPVSYHGRNVTLDEAMEKTLATVDHNLTVEHTHGAFFITSKDDPARLNNVMPFVHSGAGKAREPEGLAKNMGPLKLEGEPLADVLELVHKNSHLVIDVDWDALKLAGIDRSTKANLELRNATAGDLLYWTLRTMKAKIPLNYAVEKEKLLVSTIEGLEKTPAKRGSQP